MKKIFLYLVCFSSALIGSVAFANCGEYLKEAQSVSGAVPRFTNAGDVEAVLAFGEGTFLSNKPSLIATARKKAELDAKRNFSSWLRESVVAETTAQTMLEQLEATNERGETAGMAVELTRVIDTMRSNTNATLEGMTKLDECVDTEKGVVLVTFGWKPNLIKTQTAHKNVVSPTDVKNSKAAPIVSQVQTTSEIDCRGGVNIVTVEVDGSGVDQTSAINDALRLAVGQVHGEKFAASLTALSADMSAQETRGDGTEKITSLSSQALATAVQSNTEGLIDSYSIVKKSSKENGTVDVSLKVNLPKFKPSTCEVTKQKIVITLPAILKGREADPSFVTTREMIHRELESLLDGTNRLTVLNRANIGALDTEAALMQTGDFSINEQSKLGNRVGADYVVVTEISDFTVREESQQAGSKTIKLSKMRGQAWVRVIDLATTNTVFSVRVPVEAIGNNQQVDTDYFALSMARQLALTVGDSIGGGFNDNGIRQLRSIEKKVGDYELAAKRVDEQMNKIKKETDSKW